jgi:hypothetical protein
MNPVTKQKYVDQMKGMYRINDILRELCDIIMTADREDQAIPSPAPYCLHRILQNEETGNYSGFFILTASLL